MARRGADPAASRVMCMPIATLGASGGSPFSFPWQDLRRDAGGLGRPRGFQYHCGADLRETLSAASSVLLVTFCSPMPATTCSVHSSSSGA